MAMCLPSGDSCGLVYWSSLTKADSGTSRAAACAIEQQAAKQEHSRTERNRIGLLR
jgi:hypothetical protein